MQAPSSLNSQTTSTAVTSRQLLSAAFALMLGGLLVLTVGFAPMDVAHNAAHDTRHSSAFPCH